MSESDASAPQATPDPSSPGAPPASSSPPSSPSAAGRSEQKAPASSSKEKQPDPLRGSRTSGIWVAVLVLAIVLLLLAIFIIQNTAKVKISFLGWDGHAPLAAALLIAAVAGALLVASAGMLRILQLRRRVRRERRR